MILVYFGVWVAISVIYTLGVVQLFCLLKKKQLQSVDWGEMFWLFLILVLLPTLVIFLMLMAIYRRFVSIVLLIQHKQSFGGLLSPSDTVHVIESPKKSKLRVLLVVQYKKNSAVSFYETVKNTIYRTNLIDCPKACAIFQKFLGYYYYLKEKVELHECIHQLSILNDGNKIVDRSTFMRFLHESEEIPLPKNNFALWDVFIGINPIYWKSQNANNDYEYYPILFRYHHCLFDGFHLIKTIFDNFSDYKIMDSPSPINRLQQTADGVSTTFRLPHLLDLINLIKLLCAQLYVISILPWRFCILTKTLAKDSNALCGKALSDKKLFSFYTEETSHYIKIIKKIKKKCPGASFTDVILTALSASLSTYLKKKHPSDVPEFITVATPEVPHATELLRMTKPSRGNTQLQCENKVLFSLRKLPIRKSTLKIYDRLHVISKQGSYFKNPQEVQADYMIAHLSFMLLPSAILLRFMKSLSYTAIVTNLPGPSSTSFFGGQQLQDMVIWSISKETTATGISFIIFTYDNRLEITISADQEIISSHSGIKSILKNIFISLDDLYCAIKEKNCCNGYTCS